MREGRLQLLVLSRYPFGGGLCTYGFCGSSHNYAERRTSKLWLMIFQLLSNHVAASTNTAVHRERHLAFRYQDILQAYHASLSRLSPLLRYGGITLERMLRRPLSSPRSLAHDSVRNRGGARQSTVSMDRRTMRLTQSHQLTGTECSLDLKATRTPREILQHLYSDRHLFITSGTVITFDLIHASACLETTTTAILDILSLVQTEIESPYVGAPILQECLQQLRDQRPAVEFLQHSARPPTHHQPLTPPAEAELENALDSRRLPRAAA
ncbi:hypothetical protein KC329_g7 [Hortaea werneckii]|nr:hypothetical protein KC329_g7 [Hortaea werneckii]